MKAQLFGTLASAAILCSFLLGEDKPRKVDVGRSVAFRFLSLSVVLRPIAILIVAIVLCVTRVSGQGGDQRVNPSVVIDDFPQPGESKLVLGHVIDRAPGQFAVSVVINVFNTFWSKPYWSTPLSSVNLADGSWSCNVFTGGADFCNQEILAFLVPADLNPVPLAKGEGSVPAELEMAALAKTSVVRGASTTIAFSGYDWVVKHTADCRWDPGRNLWSRDLVSVDPNTGWLRLRVAVIDGQVRCAEISTKTSTQKPLGLGTFRVSLASSVGQLAGLDSTIIGGAFTFSPSVPATAFDEVDLWEYSNGAVVGAPSPFQFVVQPYQDPSRRWRYTLDETNARRTTSHSVTWSRVPGKPNTYAMVFTTTDSATGEELVRWHFEEERSSAPASDLAFHLNLWAAGDTLQQPAEIVIKQFQWLPLAPTIQAVPHSDGVRMVVTCDSPTTRWNVQESADLITWTLLKEVLAGEGTDASILIPTPSTARFFRVVSL